MKYLQTSFDLAESRGYLRDPRVLAVKVPEWFTKIGTDEGLRAFEARHQLSIPAAVRELYQLPLLAAFVEHAMDGEILLENFRELFEIELPAVLDAPEGAYLVIAFHNHSGQICAVKFGEDDPHYGFGIEDEAETFSIELTSHRFSEFIGAIVSNHV